MRKYIITGILIKFAVVLCHHAKCNYAAKCHTINTYCIDARIFQPTQNVIKFYCADSALNAWLASGVQW